MRPRVSHPGLRPMCVGVTHVCVKLRSNFGEKIKIITNFMSKISFKSIFNNKTNLFTFKFVYFIIFKLISLQILSLILYHFTKSIIKCVLKDGFSNLCVSIYIFYVGLSLLFRN